MIFCKVRWPVDMSINYRHASDVISVFPRLSSFTDMQVAVFLTSISFNTVELHHGPLNIRC